MNTPHLDKAKTRAAWNDRIVRVTGVPEAVGDVTEWARQIDGPGADRGYSLDVSTAGTSLSYEGLLQQADAFARDVNRRVEIHTAHEPLHLKVMVWFDRIPDDWCGARTLVEPDKIAVFCDRELFHQDPYIASHPEDGELVEHTDNPHHAPIPSAYGHGKQGDTYWPVGPLHVIPEDPHGIREVLHELECQPLTDDEKIERDGLVSRTDPHGINTAADLFGKRRARRQWDQVRDRLTAQLAHRGKTYPETYPETYSEDLVTEVARDIERDGQLTDTRRQLWSGINTAYGEVGDAQRALRDMLSDGVYDIEYAHRDGRGNETAEQIKSLLANVRRDLAAARALMPTDRNGDMKNGNITG